MTYPKKENWTKRHSEQVLKRISRLFVIYENCSNLDENGKEISQKAIDADLEMIRLWDSIPIEHRPCKSLTQFS